MFPKRFIGFIETTCRSFGSGLSQSMNYGPDEIFSFLVGLFGSWVGYLVGIFGDRHSSGSQFVTAHCPDCSPTLHCHPPVAATPTICPLPLLSFTGLGCITVCCALGFAIGSCRPRFTGWATSQHRAAGGATVSLGEAPTPALPRARAPEALRLTLPAAAETVVWQSRRRSPTADGSEPGLH